MTTKVVYVIGQGRSGSTLLDVLLGQVDGVGSCGEVARLWDRGIRDGFGCGCGRPVPACPRWSRVIEDLGEVDVGAVRRAQASTLSARGAFRLLTGRADPGDASYEVAMGRVYRSIADHWGVDVIVDSSKWPLAPGVLGRIGGVQPVVVHLVRDPRATVYSWLTPRDLPDRGAGAQLPVRGAMRSILGWWVKNLAAAYSLRTAPAGVTLRYEDLVTDPVASLRRILDAVGIDEPDLSFLRDTSARVAPTHTVAGNPARFASDSVQLRLDERWRSGLSPSARRLTTAICAPLMAHYGYRLVTRRSVARRRSSS